MVGLTGLLSRGTPQYRFKDRLWFPLFYSIGLGRGIIYANLWPIFCVSVKYTRRVLSIEATQKV